MQISACDDMESAGATPLHLNGNGNDKVRRADGIALLLTQWISNINTYSHALDVLKTQLPKTAQMVESSTRDLSDQFIELARGARTQSEQVGRITAMAGTLPMGDERITLEEFNALFSKTLSDSINQILFVSKQAISMVYQLDEAMQNLSSIEGFVKEIQTINKQANLLALNAAIESVRAGEAGRSFGVVANEVKQISKQINSLSVNMRQRISTVSQSVESGYKTLQEVATADMTENIMAQKKLNLLMDGMIQQNTSFSRVLVESAHASAELSRTISGMVVGMQFQDRNTQYIDNSVNLISDMQNRISRLKSDSIRLIPELAGLSHDTELAGHIYSQFRLSEFAQMFMALCEGRPMPESNASGNTAATSGDDDSIELF
jgi:methyl-accepting chemotaxis protein